MPLSYQHGYVQVNQILHPDMPWTHDAWQMEFSEKTRSKELVSKNSNNFSDLHLHFLLKMSVLSLFHQPDHQKDSPCFFEMIRRVSLKIEEQKRSLCSFLVQSSLHCWVVNHFQLSGVPGQVMRILGFSLTVMWKRQTQCITPNAGSI